MGERTFSYRELEIWRIGMDIAEATYRLTADLPSNERYGLSSHMRRAAVSIPSSIAEGWGHDSHVQLAKFIRIARASANELESQLELARRMELVTSTDSLDDLLASLGRKSHAFLKRIEEDLVREDRAEPLSDLSTFRNSRFTPDLSPFTFHLSLSTN